MNHEVLSVDEIIDSTLQIVYVQKNATVCRTIEISWVSNSANEETQYSQTSGVPKNLN
ncbi:MAG: hypothetical protein RI993_2292 [Pseudomonadota bacterium]|jgi:hypothetical protein